MITDTSDSVTVRIRKRSEMEDALDSATRALALRAHTLSYGLLVTRNDPYTFTVSLSRSVPYGETVEHTAW